MTAENEAPWNRLPRWVQRAYCSAIGLLAALLLLRFVTMEILALPTWLAAGILFLLSLALMPSLFRWVMSAREEPGEKRHG